MTDSSPAAAVERRRETLRSLDGTPATRASLAARLDVSRSTAARALRELATHGFVASTDDGYRATVPGRLALAADGQRERLIDAAAAVAPLFDGVSLSFDLDPAVLDDARIVEARPHAPTRPVERVAALVADATHVSVYTARVLPPHARLYHDRMTGTVVAAGRVIERHRSERSGKMWEAIDRGRVAVRRLDRDDPVSLVLAETPAGPEMGLVVYRDGAPRGFVGTDAPAATRWARDLHERLWTGATPL